MTHVSDTISSLSNLPELLLPYERDSFLWLNNTHNGFWDVFMTFYSGKLLWIPLTLILLFITFYKTKWQTAVLFVCCFVLLATLCDQLSASVVKPFFSRLRPTHHPDFMDSVTIVDGYRGGRYGFVSAHAANGFGVITFLSLVYKNRWLTASLIIWGLITCYSRIYLGVHFITDIIGGILLGSFLGFLIYLLYQYLRVNLLRQSLREAKQSVYSKRHATVLIIAIWTTILFNFIYSFVVYYSLK